MQPPLPTSRTRTARQPLCTGLTPVHHSTLASTLLRRWRRPYSCRWTSSSLDEEMILAAYSAPQNRRILLSPNQTLSVSFDHAPVSRNRRILLSRNHMVSVFDHALMSRDRRTLLSRTHTVSVSFDQVLASRNRRILLSLNHMLSVLFDHDPMSRTAPGCRALFDQNPWKYRRTSVCRCPGLSHFDPAWTPSK